jgi:guanine nucleotide-binding protein subunit alpha
MLLGQAESGKSTLQKQFQLYYASNSLDRERPAWRPVVYFNIIKAVRMILEELDFTFSQPTHPPLPHHSHSHSHSRSHSLHRQQQHGLSPSPLSASPRGSPPHHAYSPVTPGTPGTSTPINIASGSGSSPNSYSYSDSPSTGLGPGIWPTDLSALRTKLLPLVAVEDALASDLSGGVTVAGGRTGVFVRAGWQAFVQPALSRAWAGISGNGAGGGGGGVGVGMDGDGGGGGIGGKGTGPPVNDLVARMLAATRDEVEALWRHPNVRALVKYRKLRLEESASL